MDLYRFCLKRRPYIVLCLPAQLLARRRYKKGSIDRTMLKQAYYRFFRYMDMERMSKRFWDANMDKLFDWYPDLHRDDDVVISASPEFHIREICSRMGITNVIASDVDPKNGHCLGPNCRDEEKVRRFREQFGDAKIEAFYSDEEHDAPMARLADKAFLIRDGKPVEWVL